MAIHTEAEITIDRPRAEVFDYLAHAESLPAYVQDFEKVAHEEPGEPARGHVYSYRMKRGGVEGTFEWTDFQPPERLAWEGPAVKSGPGSMKPSGSWELSDAGAGTHVKLVMTPEPGGLFKLAAPFFRMNMSKGNAKALQRLKDNLENGA
ncbi:MAG: SRPBCC family protein [Thermoleophilaceae bacterium]|jgi:uncharacterized protein YndB with AHSA1/START domain